MYMLGINRLLSTHLTPGENSGDARALVEVDLHTVLVDFSAFDDPAMESLISSAYDWCSHVICALC